MSSSATLSYPTLLPKSISKKDSCWSLRECTSSAVFQRHLETHLFSSVLSRPTPLQFVFLILFYHHCAFFFLLCIFDYCAMSMTCTWTRSALQVRSHPHHPSPITDLGVCLLQLELEFLDSGQSLLQDQLLVIHHLLSGQQALFTLCSLSLQGHHRLNGEQGEKGHGKSMNITQPFLAMLLP